MACSIFHVVKQGFLFIVFAGAGLFDELPFCQSNGIVDQWAPVAENWPGSSNNQQWLFDKCLFLFRIKQAHLQQ
jgi:hypothetical protein